MCSPLVFENMIYNTEGKTLDGLFISANSNKLLFEPEWGEKVSEVIFKAVKETHKIDL